MISMEIGEVARQSGLPASTLRYYEEKGLIQSVGRKGIKRLYDPEVMQRLALISMGSTAGFSLDESAAMLADQRFPDINRQTLIRRAAELDEQIQRLTEVRDGLLHAAACPAPNHFECPVFQRLMKLVFRRNRSRKSGG